MGPSIVIIKIISSSLCGHKELQDTHGHSSTLPNQSHVDSTTIPNYFTFPKPETKTTCHQTPVPDSFLTISVFYFTFSGQWLHDISTLSLTVLSRDTHLYLSRRSKIHELTFPHARFTIFATLLTSLLRVILLPFPCLGIGFGLVFLGCKR